VGRPKLFWVSRVQGQAETRALGSGVRGGHGDLLRFGLDSLLRGPAVVLRLLAAALVPWTALLALCDAQHWFPAPAIKWAWVGFDVLLTGALFRLATRWSRRLGIATASAISIDAALTWLEAGLYNWPRVGSWLEAALIALSMLTPCVAALILWRAHRRHQIARSP
jgi:phosphatidylglycerol lysyltransferase